MVSDEIEDHMHVSDFSAVSEARCQRESPPQAPCRCPCRTRPPARLCFLAWVRLVLWDRGACGGPGTELGGLRVGVPLVGFRPLVGHAQRMRRHRLIVLI